jgi:hypothetical protein
VAIKLNTDTSIVDYLKSQNKDSSYSARKELASTMGITNYSGTASQNTQMLKTLKSQESAKSNNAAKNETKTDKVVEKKAEPKAETKADDKGLSSASIINGVDDATSQKLNSSFVQSDESKALDNNVSTALNNYTNIASKDSIISGDVYTILGSKFEVPAEVTQADIYLRQQLEKIQSGKTSYSDDVQNMMDKIMNREKFSYDVDTDPLFQQALASAMKSGNQAMQDTIGQASALTGGYGSTYATSAGNQAYNSFIEDAYNNLPQYYQMALEAYQMEGDEMYRQLDMFNSADDKEFNRILSAYDTTYQHRNRVYDEAYTQFRDNKSDVLAMANLELAEHGQLSSDAYNLYNATSNYADTLYAREYNKWNDEVNQALQYAQMQNNDYWNQTNFDEGVRQYEQNYAENVRQFDKSYEQTEKWNQAEMDYKNAALKQDNEQFYANLNYQKSKGSGSGSGGSGGNLKSPTQAMMKDALKAYNEGSQKYNEYMASIPDSYDKSIVQEYVASYGEDWVADYNEYSGWTIKDDTYNGGGWLLGTGWFGTGGEDHNDTYTKGNSDSLTYDQLKEKINASAMPQEKKDELLDALKKQSKR